MPPQPSTILSTANALIDAYNSWSLPAILAVRSPNCRHHILPTSLGIPPMNNTAYKAWFEGNMPKYQDFALTVRDTIVDESARKVSMHVTSTAMTEMGEYANEYMMVLHMTEDGGLVERVLEFVDSEYSVRFRRELERRWREKSGEKL